MSDRKTRSAVGHNVDKVDAFKLARGEAVYTDDFTRTGMLTAKVLRSPHAHARIVKVDVSAAMALEGVIDVIWHKDVKAIAHTRAGQSYPEPSPYDTVIMPHKARFIGDRVAVVAAETTAIVNVNVIPMTSEVVLDAQTVIIADGVIRAIGDKIKHAQLLVCFFIEPCAERGGGFLGDGIRLFYVTTAGSFAPQIPLEFRTFVACG